MFEKTLRIPKFGFTFERRERIIDLDRAKNVLTTKFQQRCTYAVRERNSVRVACHVAVCPHCGKETPAYEKFLGTGDECCHSMPKREVAEWASGQLSLFRDWPRVLRFNHSATLPNVFVCSHCGRTAQQSNGYITAKISVNRKRITVSRWLESSEIFRVFWFSGDINSATFPIWESVTFNFRNGHTFLSLESDSSGRLSCFDVTNQKISKPKSDPIWELILQYKSVYRELNRQFVKMLNRPLPFHWKIETPERYVLMTRFVGYDPGFYWSLPYAEDETVIEKRFLKSAQRLHNAKNVPALFEKTNLPNTKNIREIFFQRPELLFYTEELERLWEIFADINHFCTFLSSLSSSLACLNLWWFQKIPHLIDFYLEYAAVFGKEVLLKSLTDYRYALNRYAVKYFVSDDQAQEDEQEKWCHLSLWEPNRVPLDLFIGIDKVVNCSICDSPPIFRLPYLEVDSEDYSDYQIGSYSFKLLKSSDEYLRAGKELGSYQVTLSILYEAVIGILKENRYVSAVAINGHLCEIVQTYTFKGRGISVNSPLGGAFELWRKRAHLSFGEVAARYVS